MIGSPDALAIYLNDHLAGATGGTELARRVAAGKRDSAQAATFERLAAEIAQDRESLLRIMGQLAVRTNPAKVAAGWLGEKVGRFKLNGRLLSRAPLSDVLEAELLRLGVTGKAAGWRALRAVAEVDDRLDRDDLDSLIQRADRQVDELEELRVQAAAAAFVASPAKS
ncbi:MAG TPA: hypothetical protein VHW44_11460 [Pseudonocardiaceae bacterium]|jgi:hypothetical protein|nr:hypothetical protein [Pseudonocardiaceae bacterium]